ncbi:MAG: hypothetical protein ACFCD0_19915 [Gemmataceae bacterium]
MMETFCLSTLTVVLSIAGNLSNARVVLEPDSDTPKPLAIAKHLAKTKYKGWTYGTNAKKKQLNCVQFVGAVVERATNKSLSRKMRSRIYISNLSATERKRLPKLIQNEDPRTKGIQHALVSMGRGKIVSPTQAKPGDFVQYWMKRPGGTWFGHAAIIESVSKNGNTVSAKLYGSHQTRVLHLFFANKVDTACAKSSVQPQDDRFQGVSGSPSVLRGRSPHTPTARPSVRQTGPVHC